jgi:hypothetical protein
MRYRSAILLLTLGLAGCSQPEGTVPRPGGEHLNKTEDLSRDLQGVATNENGAANDLRQDLANLTAAPPPDHLLNELSNRLTEALPGTSLSDETAMKLATYLYVGTSARELSQRQVATLRQDVTATLTGTGVPPPKAEPVGLVVEQIQIAINTNRKRFWHLR